MEEFKLSRTNPEGSSIDFSSKNISEDLLYALKNNGFVILKNHGVPLNLLDTLYKDWKMFFDSDKKFQWLRDEKDDEGYVPINIEKAVGYDIADNKEFYQTHLDGRYPDFINLKTTKVLFKSIVNLGIKLIHHIDEALPAAVKNTMDVSLTNMISGCKKHGFRVIHYPPAHNNNFSPRASAHGDICLLTILPNATSRGLELQDSEGNWNSPHLDEHDIIVFNADLIEIATNEYLKSTIHKVSNIEPEVYSSRLSFPIFIHPKRKTILKPGVTALDLLRARFTELGFRGDQFEG